MVLVKLKSPKQSSWSPNVQQTIVHKFSFSFFSNVVQNRGVKQQTKNSASKSKSKVRLPETYLDLHNFTFTRGVLDPVLLLSSVYLIAKTPEPASCQNAIDTFPLA